MARDSKRGQGAPRKGRNMKIVKYMAALLACAGVANADMITLSDPSFESGFGGSMANPGSGWFTFGNAAGGESVNGDGYWNMTNTDGTDASYATQIAENDGGSIYQAVTLDAGVEYQFTVGAGMSAASAAYKNHAKIAVVIYNSSFDTLLAETTGTLTAFDGVFSDYSVSFTPSTTGTYHVGARNRGYVAGTGGNSGESTAFFDNARLSVIPEPATFGLALAASAAMLVRRRRFG